MSLQTAAKHLESKGRGPDTMLVHMAPSEVRGLQALAMAHGGSLSINPETGLAEAGFLKQILPMVVGAALSPFITPMGAAALVGGFETARTGDIGKGLLAGLGAYGGAGLTSGLTAGASSAATETAAANALGVPASAGATATGATSQAGMLAAENAAMGLTPVESAANIASSAGYASGAAPMSAGMQTANLASSGIGNVLSNPTTALPQVYSALPTGTLPATAATVANAMTPEYEVPGVAEEDYGPYKLKRLSANFQGSTPVQPNPYYRPAGLGYAAGGDVMLAAGGSYDDEPKGDDQGYGFAAGGVASYSNQGRVRDLPESVGIPRTGIFRDTDSDTALKDAWEATQVRNKKLAKATNVKLAAMPKTSVKGLGDVEQMAGGGLGGYSDGGRMLKGPGDGMSDSIPATIGRKQPARLADGEFVVPADVVSHLGNGSTDAGAKRLYTMMDKIRKARTGKKKQAPAVKAEKYLPV